jgi:hypothetical protein
MQHQGTMRATMGSTTVRIDTETRNELRSRGRMGESYDDVIRRLLATTPSEGASRSEARARPTLSASRSWFPKQDRE